MLCAMRFCVLGIESSCDETGVAVYDRERGLLAESLYSQVDLHATYGGVVPELAARDHAQRLPELIEATLDKAAVPVADITAVAYTAGPGLVGALLAGAATAAGLATAWQCPLLAVHHMEAHLLAPFMGAPAAPEFPFVALLVSGGHTLLVHAQALGVYRVLGQTLDDAVGEAFDKSASVLGLPYPGGAALARLAAQASGPLEGVTLPRPMTRQRALDFSFSGLKTAFALAARDHDLLDPAVRSGLARAFEDAAVETLVRKCLWALDAAACARLIVGGGVGANQQLQQQLAAALAPRGAQLLCPPPALCTDNGAMIAHVAARRGTALELPADAAVVHPRWSLESLTPPAPLPQTTSTETNA